MQYNLIQHAVVDDCVAKILEDNRKMSLELVLVWATNAKNYLQMVSSWSPYELVFAVNPHLPSVLVDKGPALERTTVSEHFKCFVFSQEGFYSS